jgi:hypothetical protein
VAYPSTFVDIQNAVINKLRLDSTNDLSKVKDWVNQVYAQAVEETEANVTLATMSLTANSYSYTLPSGILRIKSMVVTPVGSTVSAPLQSTTLDYILRRRQSAGGATALGGYVSHYALLGLNDFEVYPTPASADSLTIYYVAAPTALSADADVTIFPEPFATKILEYGASAEGADFKGDPSESEYRALYDQWIMKLRSHMTRKRGGQPGQFNLFPGAAYPPHDPSTDTGV